MRPHRALYALKLAALLALAAPPASAGEAEEALEKGKKLYDEAVVLLEKKKFSEACPKLEEAVRLVPVAVGARLALAECDEGRGRLASALAGYRKAQSLAASAGQADREALARTEADRLQARAGKIRLGVAPADAALEGLTVTLDGTPVEAAALSAPIPSDAGKHTIRAQAKGRAPFVQEVAAVDGAEITVSITLAPATSSPGSGDASPGKNEGGISPLFVTGLAAGGAGLIALGVGTAMGGIAASKNDESFNLGCVKGSGCPAGPATDARRAAYDAATLSTALFIGGGVLAAAGVAVVIAVPSRSAKPAVTGVAFRIGPTGIVFEGAFQ